ncbi:US2 [anatid alphaherpesvirus 1]|uniref:US2 n=1 Tax=anatid alphaherpesvirus 1 TaxID=104388 RepID=G3GR53_9ALPH|nr:US2 [Anatid alphaherpesvirus 1]AEN80134.1 US2 [Anatid alphaherpesvirus 1]UEC79354.1 US2 [Anatid alphaherpesvirus 1]
MGVVILSIATLIGENGRLPGRTRDASVHLWDILFKQCAKMMDDSLGIPVVIRPANLRRCAGKFMSMPRAHRPILRLTNPLGTGANGTGLAGRRDVPPVQFYEDGSESTEWTSVLAGYDHLSSGILGNHTFDMWIIGAADICKPAIEQLPNSKRFITIKVPGTWSGLTWEKPDGLSPLTVTEWDPCDDETMSKDIIEKKLVGIKCCYDLIGQPAAAKHNSELDDSKDVKCCNGPACCIAC